MDETERVLRKYDQRVEELQDIAQRLRRQSDECGALLERPHRLNDHYTWSGQIAQRYDEQLREMDQIALEAAEQHKAIVRQIRDQIEIYEEDLRTVRDTLQRREEARRNPDRKPTATIHQVVQTPELRELLHGPRPHLHAEMM